MALMDVFTHFSIVRRERRGIRPEEIKEKVTEAGGFYVEVPTQKIKPSQTCPNCGHQKKKSLAERVHRCEKCGYSCDRDVAAAQVMLNNAYRDWETDRKSTRLNSSHSAKSRMPSSA